MKLLTTISLLSIAAIAAVSAFGQNPNGPNAPLPIPDEPKRLVIIIDADGERTRWNLSDDDIYIFNRLTNNGSDTMDIRFIRWLVGIRNAVADRPEFAPPGIKADNDAIQQREIQKRRKIEQGVGTMSKDPAPAPAPAPAPTNPRR